MANNPTEWSDIDIATAEEVDKMLTSMRISNRQIDRMTNGAIGYSRIRNIRAKEKSPMRIGEFFLICDICGADPLKELKRIRKIAGEPSNANDQLSDEERMRIVTERANNDDYGLAASRGSYKNEHEGDWDNH